MIHKFDLNSNSYDVWFEKIVDFLREKDSLVIYDSSEQNLNQDFYEQFDSKKNQIGIFSSGSTGRPKLLIHSIDDLLSFKAKEKINWSTFYRPDRMAGLQAILHAWKSKGDLIFLDAKCSLSNLSEKVFDKLKYIDSLSGTPSQFRHFDKEFFRHMKSLKSITLGGEAVEQADINLLKSLSNGAKIYQIYASSEYGAMCTVKDEIEGLPTKFFKGENPRFKISDKNEILVKPFTVAKNHKSSNNYFATGDLVELHNDRYYFVGRSDNRVSVGGVLVSPEKIEKSLREMPEVTNCRVIVKKNPILGSIMVGEVVPSTSAITEEEILKKYANEPIWKKPHKLKFCDSIPVSDAGKVKRE